MSQSITFAFICLQHIKYNVTFAFANPTLQNLENRDMSDDIKHQGLIDAVAGNHVSVRIVQSSACAQCQISGRCGAAESKEKVIDVFTPETSRLHEGDSVTVVASGRVGFMAVLLCAVVPLCLVLLVLAAMIFLTGNEAVAALGGIASLIPYYIILYLLRERIGTKVAFRLENY